MNLTIDTPISERPTHALGCGIQHNCKDADCANGKILAENPHATQDAEKPWWIYVPMSDADIVEADERRAAFEAEQVAANAAAEAKAAKRAAVLAALADAAGLAISEIEDALT